MHELDPSLTQKLATADEDTLKEIVREAECFLHAQLQSALAADQRAMMFGGILVAALALVVGAIATLAGVGKLTWSTALPVAVMVGCLVIAIHHAARAAQPCRFEFVGNDPDQWIEDNLDQSGFRQSLAEQAAFYSQDIKNNAEAMNVSAEHIKSSASWAVVAAAFGLGGAIFWFVQSLWHLVEPVG